MVTPLTGSLWLFVWLSQARTFTSPAGVMLTPVPNPLKAPHPVGVTVYKSPFRPCAMMPGLVGLVGPPATLPRLYRTVKVWAVSAVALNKIIKMTSAAETWMDRVDDSDRFEMDDFILRKSPWVLCGSALCVER